MQSYQFILAASSILLVAFAVERASTALRVPSVIAMIGTGIAARWLAQNYQFELSNVESIVSTLGSIGLVLIVLEGALDLELSRQRWRVASQATAAALLGVLLCAGLFALGGAFALGLPWHQSLLFSIPLAIISSAVAIPSAHLLPPDGKEFVVYESSMSDIFGVLVFFSVATSDGTVRDMVAGLLGGGGVSLVISLLLALAMVGVLSRLSGHVRFIPLLAGLFALYATGKLLHLSPLVLVLVFGLLLNNYNRWTRFRPIRRWADSAFPATVLEFKGFVRELTFAARGIFFVLLGYWARLSDLLFVQVWLIAGCILAVIYTTRYLLLAIFDHPLSRALTCVAPRGLITVLLYFTARSVAAPPPYFDGAVLLVVLISSTVTLLAGNGLMTAPTRDASRVVRSID